MRRRLISGALALVALAALAACTEQPQTITTKSKDVPAWEGAKNGFSAPGWKAGDEAAWQEQLRQRARGQNEYGRIGGA